MNTVTIKKYLYSTDNVLIDEDGDFIWFCPIDDYEGPYDSEHVITTPHGRRGILVRVIHFNLVQLLNSYEVDKLDEMYEYVMVSKSDLRDAFREVYDAKRGSTST